MKAPDSLRFAGQGVTKQGQRAPYDISTTATTVLRAPPLSHSADNSANSLQTPKRFCRTNGNRSDAHGTSLYTPEGANSSGDVGTTLMTSGGLTPSWNGTWSRIAELDERYRVYTEELQRVIAERDQLETKVRVMEEERIQGRRKIRELIDENRELQAAVEQTEVRLGIAEIEQRSMLEGAQHLRQRLAESLQELESERQKIRSACLASNTGKILGSATDVFLSTGGTSTRDVDAPKRLLFSVPGDIPTPPVVETFTKREETFRDESAVDRCIGENCSHALLVANRNLEVRCCVLERQVRHLFDLLHAHGYSTSDIVKGDNQLTF